MITISMIQNRDTMIQHDDDDDDDADANDGGHGGLMVLTSWL